MSTPFRKVSERINPIWYICRKNKGLLTEQYVCQVLVAGLGMEQYYWSAESLRGKVDFIFAAVKHRSDQNQIRSSHYGRSFFAVVIVGRFVSDTGRLAHRRFIKIILLSENQL